MTEYRVRFVSAKALPPGTEWVLTRSEEYDRICCFLKWPVMSADVLAQAWAAYRRMEAKPPSSPEQQLSA